MTPTATFETIDRAAAELDYSSFGRRVNELVAFAEEGCNEEERVAMLVDLLSHEEDGAVHSWFADFGITV